MGNKIQPCLRIWDKKGLFETTVDLKVNPMTQTQFKKWIKDEDNLNFEILTEMRIRIASKK